MIKLFPFLFILLWSSAFITSKIIVDNAPPFLSLSIRFGIVAFLFFLFFIFFSKNKYISLNAIKNACDNNEYIMEPIINATKEDVTLGEIIDVMKAEFGEWKETSAF